MKKTSRLASKSAKAAPVRSAPRQAAKRKTVELTPEEVTHLETISNRYEESERAWARMTAPPDGDETWTQVEEHLLARGTGDPDRRWKYFSK
jgi:hypothetical protein